MRRGTVLAMERLVNSWLPRDAWPSSSGQLPGVRTAQTSTRCQLPFLMLAISISMAREALTARYKQEEKYYPWFRVYAKHGYREYGDGEGLFWDALLQDTVCNLSQGPWWSGIFFVQWKRIHLEQCRIQIFRSIDTLFTNIGPPGIPSYGNGDQTNFSHFTTWFPALTYWTVWSKIGPLLLTADVTAFL